MRSEEHNWCNMANIINYDAKQVGLDGNVSDTLSRDARFESRQEYLLSVLRFFPEITLKWATTAPLHIHYN
jgi:hypothetical protein